MKKILIILLVAFVVGLASCKKQKECFFFYKTCTCKTYASGIVISTDDEVELESGKKCSDLNTYVVDSDGNNKTGIECKDTIICVRYVRYEE